MDGRLRLVIGALEINLLGNWNGKKVYTINFLNVENAYVFVYANTHSGSATVDNDVEIYIYEIWAEK